MCVAKDLWFCSCERSGEWTRGTACGLVTTQVPLPGVQSRSPRHQVCCTGRVYLRASLRSSSLNREGTRFIIRGLRFHMYIDEKGGEPGLLMRKGGACALSQHVCARFHVDLGWGCKIKMRQVWGPDIIILRSGAVCML